MDDLSVRSFDAYLKLTPTSATMPTEFWKTLNDLPAETRNAAISLLQQTLVDLIDLGLQAKQAHWNVKGPHFIALHELFDHVEDELAELADEVAERAVALGGVVRATVQIVQQTTRLPAYPADILDGATHVRSFGAALAQAGKSSRAAIAAVDEAGDADTADVLTQVSRALDKLLWKVEAHGVTS